MQKGGRGRDRKEGKQREGKRKEKDGGQGEARLEQGKGRRIGGSTRESASLPFLLPRPLIPRTCSQYQSWCFPPPPSYTHPWLHLYPHYYYQYLILCHSTRLLTSLPLHAVFAPLQPTC